MARRAVRLGQKISPDVGAVRQDMPKTAVSADEPQRVIAIGSSTGGPTALTEILAKMGNRFPHAVLIAQHMPEKFTRTFAERLDRRSQLRVREAQDRDFVEAGTALLCPGRYCMELERVRTGTGLALRVTAPGARDRYAPSADRLLTSVASVVGERAVGIVLTGMGDDGAKGARAIRDAGGYVIAESRSTAIVYGMPGAAVREGAVHRSLALHDIASWLAELDEA
jgi:two-component system chemotaxis response regulator CheB